MTMVIICKCCGQAARWCNEGPDACGSEGCDHIHCDHCGMHYALESKDMQDELDFDKRKALMLATYNQRNPY